MIINETQLKVFQSIVTEAKKKDVTCYLVGGYIRDLLLFGAMNDKDIDVVIEGDAIAFAAHCAEGWKGKLKKFPKFGTAKIVGPYVFSGINEIDFASAREELYEKPGDLPKVYFSTIQEDLKRRDFTINAMALPIQALIENEGNSYVDKVLDYFSGKSDLNQKTIKVIHSKSFLDDPTRLYRAVRYRNRIDGNYDSETEALMQRAISIGSLETISLYRRFIEVKKLSSEQNPYRCLEEALHLGLLSFIGSKESVGKIIWAFKEHKDFDQFTKESILLQPPEQRDSFIRALQISKKERTSFL